MHCLASVDVRNASPETDTSRSASTLVVAVLRRRVLCLPRCQHLDGEVLASSEKPLTTGCRYEFLAFFVGDSGQKY